MSGWLAAAIVLIAVAVIILVLNRVAKRRQAQLAGARAAFTKPEFVSQMVGEGVSRVAAGFIWDEVAGYYFEPLRPDPTDRLKTTLMIDPDDICDIVEKFWHLEIAPNNPSEVVEIPDDPSLVEFGYFLDHLVENAADEQS